MTLAAALCSAIPSPAQANCQGRDLFPILRSEAPATYSAIEAAASAMPFARGKLFRLFRAGNEASYIYATLHLSDERVTRFSPRLRAAITELKIVALETIETGAALRRAMMDHRAAWRRVTVAQENHRPDRLLSKEDLAQLEALAARKDLPKSAAREFKPSTLAILLDLPPCANRSPTANPYVDELVANIGREREIETVGLESMLEQLEVLNGLPRETERDLLIAVLRQADRAEDVIETAIARYTSGDIGGLLAWLRSTEPIPRVSQARIPPAFVDRLITLRNLRLHYRALPLLRRGGAFIAVGATHLPGEDGLLSFLKKEGYQIEIIE